MSRPSNEIHMSGKLSKQRVSCDFSSYVPTIEFSSVFALQGKACKSCAKVEIVSRNLGWLLHVDAAATVLKDVIQADRLAGRMY
jgi:hypothetical protein